MQNTVNTIIVTDSKGKSHMDTERNNKKDTKSKKENEGWKNEMSCPQFDMDFNKTEEKPGRISFGIWSDTVSLSV